MSDDLNLGVACGRCDGPIYMETCDVPGHDWAVASECQRCGERHIFKTGCLDCTPGITDDPTEDNR